jgi:hypothetical protein
LQRTNRFRQRRSTDRRRQASTRKSTPIKARKGNALRFLWKRKTVRTNAGGFEGGSARGKELHHSQPFDSPTRQHPVRP